MALADRVLIDTSAFYALVSGNDVFHGRARRLYERLIDWERELWTTSYVLVETFALIHRRLGFQTLESLVQSLDTLQVLWIGSDLHHEAWKELAARRGTGLGFVDWTTALAAKRLRAHVFTFDEGFGREALPVIK